MKLFSVTALLLSPQLRTIWSVIVFAVSTAVFIWCLRYAMNTRKGIRSSRSAYAELVSYKIINRRVRRRTLGGYYYETVTEYKPILQFITDDGEQIEAVYHKSFSYRANREGASLPIRYFKDQPKIIYFPEEEENLYRSALFPPLFIGFWLAFSFFVMIRQFFS